jgi:DNA-binding MarR family transcriptional regulator
VVGILDKLEAKGLIERYRSTRDRRIVHSRLTGDGGALLARSPSPMGEGFETGFKARNRDERHRILLAMQKAAALSAGLGEGLN